jgi:small subunit ribosomal protein S8
MTDPIADMIIRVKNAYLARRDEVIIPHSKVKEAIAVLLKREKYVGEIEVKTETLPKQLVLKLVYVNGMPVVNSVKRLSKPGLRKYSGSKSIPRSLGGYGITIISTSQGVMTDKEARKKGIGGELLCSIW